VTLALLVTWLVFGLIVGLIARAIYPGTQSMGLFATALLGIGGSFVGGALGNLAVGVGVLTPHAAGVLGSVIGAVIVLALFGLQARSVRA
jgi:uncharacterized membrane protein YeaQ/YmgE (transglycosylase-associated protein family)